MKVRFRCPQCEYPAQIDFAKNAQAVWQCPMCDQRLDLHTPVGPAPQACTVCGTRELYKKKAFPHWLGLTILTAACLAFLALMARYEWGWAWAVLLGSAALDGILYLVVGDAVVCYRCAAHFYQVQPGPEQKPFELAIQERYRQERLRWEQRKKTAP